MNEAAKELSRIQQELKTPKGQFNKFGNYNYRNCEDILEAVKPLLGDCVLTLSDEMVPVGTGSERFYVKSTATLEFEDNVMKTSAYAREPLSQKGMSESQITGAASSYARKYALNGLFCIDDTKDDDSKDNTETKEKPKAVSCDELPLDSCGDYVIKMGKFKGKKISEVPKKDLMNYADWQMSNAKNTGKDISGPAKEFLEMLAKYLAQ